MEHTTPKQPGKPEKILFVTSDQLAFFEEAAARVHAATLANQSIEKISEADFERINLAEEEADTQEQDYYFPDNDI